MRSCTRSFAMLALTLAVVLSASVLTATSAQPCRIKICVASDFTGGAALVGEGQKKGTILAMEEINRTGGAGG